MTEYADQVRSAAQELKALNKFDVEHYVPPLQKLLDIHIELRGKPKFIANAAGNVMADEGTAEVFARVLNELSGKDSPVPEENLRLIRGTLRILTQYTDHSLKFVRDKSKTPEAVSKSAPFARCAVVRTRTSVLKTPNTKRSPLELSFKDCLVPSGVPAVKTLSFPAKNRGKAVGSCGLVKHLVNILKFKPLQDRLGEPMIREFLVNTIAVLSNISRVPENRGCLRQANVLDVMKIYSNMDDDLFKLIALQVTAHVVDSLDCDPLGTSKEAMKVLIETYKKHTVYGRYKSLDFIVFLTEELMETMFLLMTCGTERKKIVDAGAVPILVQCMKDGRYAEKQYAASGLRRLAQDPEICPQLREMGHNYGAFDYEGERVSQTTQCGFKNFVKAAWGVLSACGSTQGKEVPSNDPGVLKWGPPEVAEWLHSNGLGHYAQHFAEFDGKLFQKLLHLYQLAPEMFQMVIKEVAPLTCQDRMRLLRAVDRLLQ